MESAEALVGALDRLELPDQLVAVLADPLLQKLLLLRPAAEADRRVANWLAAALAEATDGDADEETLWEVLELARDYALQTKVCAVRAPRRARTRRHKASFKHPARGTG